MLDQFDRYCQEGRYETRSEAIRQLLREVLTNHAWETDAEDAAATLTLVYDHHRTHLAEKLLQNGHQFVGRLIEATENGASAPAAKPAAATSASATSKASAK